MKIQYVVPTVIVAAIAAAAPSHSDPELFHAELVQWVFEPCMELASALDVESYDQETTDMGIKRTDIATLMVASRDGPIRDLANGMSPDAPWEDRAAAYPAMLRLCVGQVLTE